MERKRGSHFLFLRVLFAHADLSIHANRVPFA
jgi:hypothetical protein